VSYALDFGTTNTVIARWNPLSQQAETVTLGNLSQTLTPGAALMPSVVYVENAAQNQVMVGRSVLDRGLDKSARFFQNFKRGVGAPIQGFLPELDGVLLSFERLGEWFLGEILRRLEEQEGQKLEQLILTVPVDSFETYRLWLSQICQDWAGEIYLLDEPTAAALGYGRPDANLVLVLDIGGGTADFSLVRLNAAQSAPARGFLLKGWGRKVEPKAGLKTQVIAKAGTALGGSDIDYWLQDYFCQTLNLQPSTWILRLAERLKIALSSQETATEVYFDDQALETYEFSLTRPQLEDILVKKGWFERLEGLLNQVRQQALGQGITFEQIDAVLLVGGASQTPSFQTWAEQYFTPAQICGDNPLTTVAQGALQILQGRQVQDYLYHSYGVRYWNRRKNCHSWHPIISAGQNYPMSQPVELTLGASLPNQPSIELIIGELGASSGAAEVYWDNGRLLTRSLAEAETQVYPLNDRPGARQIAQLDPPGAPGSDRVKVRFWVDEKRYLRLSVEDLLQQKLLLQEQVVAQLS